MLWTSHFLLSEGTLCPWEHDWPKVGQARSAADSTPQEISSTNEGQELMYKCSSFHFPWGDELRSVPHSLSEGSKWHMASQLSTVGMWLLAYTFLLSPHASSSSHCFSGSPPE